VTANSMTDTLLLACLLSDWNGEPTYCRWCNAALEGRRRRWCSDECASAASSNHWFNASRFAVLRRDGHTCVLCRADLRCAGSVQLRVWRVRRFGLRLWIRVNQRWWGIP
jgi:hypothetical protein